MVSNETHYIKVNMCIFAQMNRNTHAISLQEVVSEEKPKGRAAPIKGDKEHSYCR